MREFLTYLIDETLEGRAARLKELAIGIAVFRRDEDFDPRVDAVVRVEAGRLRSKLTEYYAGAGEQDPVRIEVRKGGYVPTFTSVPAADHGTARSTTMSPLVAAGVLALLVAAVTGAFLNFRSPGPTQPLVTEGLHNIAVLPLRDFSSMPQDYFSEAMTDVLIARLAELPELRVISLSSVLQYKDAELAPTQIAAELGVASIVEGTIYREDDSVRITANLIDGHDGQNLWSKTFTRPMTSVLALQNEVTSEIATQLLGELVPSSKSSDLQIDPLAYEAFLRGIYWRNRLTENGFNRGIVYFQQAIDTQPDYAEAYAGLAACHCQLGGHGIEVVRPDVALPEAIGLANRALELDSSLAEPNALLGIISYKFEWDVEAAERHLQRAIDKNPSHFQAYLWRSQIAEGSGRQEIAVEQARIAHRINPLSRAANLNLGWQIFQAGNTAEAESEFHELIEFDPEFWGGHWGLGHCYRAQGNYDEAIAQFSRAVELDGGHSLALASLGYTLAIAGQHEQALAIAEDLEARAERTYISPVHIAMVYAGLGDADTAFQWLQHALEVRARSMAWLTVMGEFDSLQDDPRYDALVASIGIVQQ